MDKINKKRLKQNYLDNLPIMVVYQISCENGNYNFLRESKNIPGIFNRLKMELRYGKCMNKDLQKYWDKYDGDAIGFSIVAELERENYSEVELSVDLQELLELYVSY